MEKGKPAEKEYQEFIDCLNRHGVDYMIIGAYAVMKHTKIARVTKDIDFWIKDNIENAKKVAAAIKDFIGIEVNPQDLLVKDEIYYIGVPPRRVDIFCNQADMDYDEVSRRKEKDKFLNSEAFFISIDDLIKLKEYYKSKENAEEYEKDIKRLEKVRGEPRPSEDSHKKTSDSELTL